MEDTKKTVLAGNGEKDVPRAVYDGVLTIDVDAQVESMEEQEEARWHQLLNAHRTRKILTGQFGGIEKLESGWMVAVTYFNGFRIIIPMNEMMINLQGDGRENADTLNRQVRIANNMLGCDIDFIIKDLDNKGKVLLAKDTLIELKTTDEEGKIQFVADLPVDSRYYIKELAAPDGYVTDQEPQEFTFEYQGSGTSVAEYAFTFEDEQTTVELSKADLTDKKELPGASLKVTDEDGNTVDEWVSKEEAHIIKGLIVGKKYKMTETKPADGYVTAESIEFTVENTKEVQKHQMLDDVTKVEISKKDITDSSEVPGAKLIILDKDGKKVESWTSTDKPHMVEKLPVGEYTLREEQAPDGYLIAEDVKFTVKDTRKIQKVKMKDAHPYGKLVTDKTGTATSGKLPIATYKNGKVEKTVEYILVETKAPNGYELSSKKEEILFEYKDGKTKVIEIVKEIKNTKSPSGSTPTGNSPKTGDSTNIWLPIIKAVWYGKSRILKKVT